MSQFVANVMAMHAGMQMPQHGMTTQQYDQDGMFNPTLPPSLPPSFPPSPPPCVCGNVMATPARMQQQGVDPRYDQGGGL